MSETPNLSNNHLVAVIEQGDVADRTARDLQAAGYGSTLVLTGEEGAQQIDAKGEHSGFFARILSQVEDHLSEATNFLKQYEEEARAGKHVVAVEVPSRDEAETARALLDRNGAQNIRFFGKLAVTDLSLESNPSPRSDASPEHQAAT
ncbi:MAG: hypothetical protein AB7P33_05495 [Dehalococcoidia bacterium]